MLIGPIDIDTVKTVIDSISDGIQIYNTDGYLVYCNEKCEMLDDILSKSAIGKHVTSIYPPLRNGANTITKVLRSGQPIYNLEQDYINYRGRRLTAITTTLPLTYHGKMVGVIEVTRSLTENRELNEKIEKLRLETEALRLSGDIGMLFGNPDGMHLPESHGSTPVSSRTPASSVRTPASGSAKTPPHTQTSGSTQMLPSTPTSHPDNFSEHNAIEQGYIFEKDEFVGLERVIQMFEKRIINTVLRQYRFNITDTANQLKIPRQTLQYKMKKYGISKPRSKESLEPDDEHS